MITYNPLGYIVATIPYEKGIKHGLMKAYYPTGSVLQTEAYEKGLLEGNSTKYFEDGKVASHTVYEKGKCIEGPYIYSPKDGSLIKSS